MTPTRVHLLPPARKDRPRPTPAEMGLEVTIAIVALTRPYQHFICVSDQMISHDDILPADDRGLIKNLQITNNWSVAFSANKIENALPLVDAVRCQIADPRKPLDDRDLQQYFTSSIAQKLQADFFRSRLGRYGYRDVEQWRRQGRDELGDQFFELCRELDGADVGVEFIVYGYDNANVARIFEVNGKGEVIDRMALQYAVVGSGYWMAASSLRRKSLTMDFHSMLYRLLEAKFSSETASGVGRNTTVTFKRRDAHDYVMWPGDIEEIRNIWEIKMRESESEEAIKIAEKHSAKLLKEERARLQSTGT